MKAKKLLGIDNLLDKEVEYGKKDDKEKGIKKINAWHCYLG